MKEQWKKYSGLGIVALSVALIVFFVIHYWDTFAHGIGIVMQALTPLVLGIGTAYVLNILLNFYERHYFPKCTKPVVRKSARPVCIAGVFLTFVLIVALIFGVIAAELMSYVNQLIAEISGTIHTLIDSLMNSHFVPESIINSLQAVDWAALFAGITTVLNFISGTFNHTVDSINNNSFDMSAVTSIAPAAIGFAISLIFAVCLLLGKERILSQCGRMMNSYIPSAWNERLHRWLATTNECFHNYIVRRCSKAVFLGTTCAVGMLILRLPFAMTISVIVGLTALFPIVGACFGMLVGLLLIFTKGSLLQAILFFALMIALHVLEDKLIYPQLVGAPVGLSFTWTLAAVAVGGGVLGFTGLIICVPVTATIYRLIKGNVEKRQTPQITGA